MKLRKIHITISSIGTIFIICFWFYQNTIHKELNNFIVDRIAHAGGGINGKKYTNSFEALSHNMTNGYKYFEIDFSFTKDGELVCLHDWKNSFKRSFGFTTDEKLTLKEFEHLVKSNSEFNKCTIYSLSEWMKLNPSATIITDVKEDNIKALKLVIATLPNATTNVIPQIYNPNNFDTIKSLGFDQIIWTLYRYDGSNEQVLAWVQKFSASFAVTMPKKRAKSTLPKELKNKNIPSYVHTINQVSEAKKYMNKHGITEIYTDFLVPKR